MIPRPYRLLCAALILATPAAAVAKGAKLYIETRGVKEPPGTKPSLVDKARALLEAELKQQPAVTTDLGSPPPDAKRIEESLKAKRLQGYGIVLRVTKASHSLNPPAKGKVYKTLMVEVAVAIDAEKIPSGQMALAGEGTAEVGTEVARLQEKERVQLTHEALAEAIKQAVVRSVAKLTAPPEKAGGPGKRAPRKRGR